VACIGEIKAIFWARGVENIYIEQPVEQYRVLESSEGYWIGQSDNTSTVQIRVVGSVPAKKRRGTYLIPNLTR